MGLPCTHADASTVKELNVFFNTAVVLVSFACSLQALNPLFNRVTFTAIVPGAYTGEAKICKKNALKWRTFKLQA